MAEQNVAITFETTKAKLKALDGLAIRANRDRSWLLNAALDRYIIYLRELLAEVEPAMEAADRGEFIEDHEVEAEVERWPAEAMDRAS